MFRSLHMKLVLIMLLLITSLMAVVGAFLTINVSNFFTNTFYELSYFRIFACWHSRLEKMWRHQGITMMTGCGSALRRQGLTEGFPGWKTD